ncbi:uncharacterized protein LOC110833869 isoform X2 [Zootermopsis nevadensis]|uniref:uncharacterized protein LOC110833869 isoform X2 n=1 Tax=Zootermopsis nevadensis TaxID=136037 RepID=UPI000B8EE63D|nr:uncharacterized protein LOC110833869 isoform X2 [Zootermopsis nevadensis]
MVERSRSYVTFRECTSDDSGQTYQALLNCSDLTDSTTSPFREHLCKFYAEKKHRWRFRDFSTSLRMDTSLIRYIISVNALTFDAA